MFTFFAQEINHLRALAAERDLWFYDESSFHLNPTVPYAWQPKDSRFTLPAQRGNVLTVAGFLRTDNCFEGYYQTSSMDQDLFRAYIDDFMTKRVHQKTVVIMDRASFHTSAKVQQKSKIGKSKTFTCSYCPLTVPSGT